MEAALGQLAGALTRIRDAAQAPALAPAPKEDVVPEGALDSTHEAVEASDGVDATPVAEDTPEADVPSEDPEPSDPSGEDDEAASYEDDWYRFLKHTQAP